MRLKVGVIQHSSSFFDLIIKNSFPKQYDEKPLEIELVSLIVGKNVSATEVFNQFTLEHNDCDILFVEANLGTEEGGYTLTDQMFNEFRDTPFITFSLTEINLVSKPENHLYNVNKTVLPDTIRDSAKEIIGFSEEHKDARREAARLRRIDRLDRLKNSADRDRDFSKLKELKGDLENDFDYPELDNNYIPDINTTVKDPKEIVKDVAGAKKSDGKHESHSDHVHKNYEK